MSRGHCRPFITNRCFRETYGNSGPILFWLNLDSKVEIDELFARWKIAKAKSYPSRRTKRGSCASSRRSAGSRDCTHRRRGES